MGDEDDGGRIREGDWVVLHACDGRKVLGNVSAGSSAKICKRKRKLSSLAGHPWGQKFAILADDTLRAVSDVPEVTIADERSMEETRDNRNLRDDTRNQRLEQSVINELKRKGVQGEELVQTVVQHSATFEGKTAFSQDKYLKKKREKFDLHVRALRPCAATLCEVYNQKSPDKTLGLRIDSLAMLLSYAGVRAGARVLIYENSIGLLAGSVAERLGGEGVAINLFAGNSTPGVEFLRMLNLPEQHVRAVMHAPLDLLDVVNNDEDIDAEPIKYAVRNNRGGDVKDAQPSEGDGADKTDGDDGGDTEFRPNPTRAEAIALRPRRGLLKQWLREGCDCLIVATRYDVVKVFDTVLKYVAPSGCFAAYCSHLQDAADLQYALQLSKMATRVELWETALVNHQVLPGRTHPHMTDSATGG